MTSSFILRLIAPLFKAVEDIVLRPVCSTHFSFPLSPEVGPVNVWLKLRQAAGCSFPRSLAFVSDFMLSEPCMFFCVHCQWVTALEQGHSHGEGWCERWYNAPSGPPTSLTRPPGARPQTPQSAGVGTARGRVPGPLAPIFCVLACDVWWWRACPGRSRWHGVIFLRSQFEKKSLILWAID